MATYFHGSTEIQAADGLQTLYLMNPTYVPYTVDGNALTLSNIPHAPPSAHPHLAAGIPLPTPPPTSEDPLRPSHLHGIGLHHYNNFWAGASLDQNSRQVTPGGAQDEFFRRSQQPVVSPSRQGLSLSLSSPQVPVNYRSTSSNVYHHDMQRQSSPSSARGLFPATESCPSSISAVSNGFSGVHGFVLGSKFLRAAQELLDEVVNVRKTIKPDQPVTDGINKEKMKRSLSTAGEVTDSGSEGIENGDHHKPPTDLTTAQRQELKMKKTKLLNMLEQVEQRYTQYQEQMQMVVSCFEQVAGLDSANSYTALALRTISKQFRCLKDAILGQIKAISKSLGEEEDWLGSAATKSTESGYSRLRYIDHQLRQQRALQQLGMVQNNAWRPQRGLPERAVSFLRAWLFEHFLHPYPKDSDKNMLAKQTGLTRSQVSNWFINARVRLWKPMVEEMYMEEIKEKKKKNLDDDHNHDDDDQENSIKDDHDDQHKKLQDSSSKSIASPSKNYQIYNAHNHHHDHIVHQESKQDQIMIIKKPWSNNVNYQFPAASCLYHDHQTSFINLTSGSSDCGIEPTGINSTVNDRDDDDQMMRSSSTTTSSKKQRILISHELQNSPSCSTVLSSEIEMIHSTAKYGDGDHDQDHHHISGSGGFGAAGYINLMDHQHHQMSSTTPRLIHGNCSTNGVVSLTLGLPHCDNLSIPGNQRSFLSNQLRIRRLELESGGGGDESGFCWN